MAALGTSPLAVEPTLSSKDRYRRMGRRFGLTVAEELTCGCHVHVGIDSDEEGVGALDRIRPWLAPLLALTANSPFWQGADSGYASYRSQVWQRWPSAGPYAPFGSPDTYHDTVAAMIDSDTVLDLGMVYFDARLSAQHPTLEVRVADVCLDVDDAVLLAALVRALVETAVRAWRAGRRADPVRLELLRLAAWRAGRSGVDGMLLDPCTLAPGPGRRRARPARHARHAGAGRRGRPGRGAGAARRGAAPRHGSAGPAGAADPRRPWRWPCGARGRDPSAPGGRHRKPAPAVARERSRALRTASQTSPTTTSPSTT